MSKELQIKIETSIALPEKNFEELKGAIENKDIQLIAPEVKDLLEVRDSMDKAKEEFEKIVADKMRLFNENYKQLTDYIENDLKPKLIEYAEATGHEKTKVNQETGEITKKFVHNLPKGMVYTRGRASFEYDESRITDDKYYKKELKKTEVKKAIENGELPWDIATVKYGAPSLSLKIADIKLGIEEKENEKDK